MATDVDALEQLCQATSGVVQVELASNAAFLRSQPTWFSAVRAVQCRCRHGPRSRQAPANPVGLGVLFGLLIGKQVGIIAASWIVIRFGLAEVPSGVNWGQIHGSAILAGVGFTMSLLASDLAFGSEQLSGFSKVGILASSALCAAVGYYVLRRR